jgi:amino acid transporter
MGLAGSLGSAGLWVMGVAASAPVVVLVGGVTTMYASTGVLGVPAAFLVLAFALAPVTGAVMAAARHVGHAATVYAVVARGFGGTAGVASGLVAVAAYTAIGCSLYGLLGSVLAGTLGGPWWGWALAAWVVVAGFGAVALTTNVTVIAVGVAVQLVIVGVVIGVGLFHPATSVGLTGFAPSRLLAGGWAGVGGVLAFGVAAFIGYESPASYVEETRTPTAVVRGGFAGLGFLGVLYAVAAWAVGLAYGCSQVVSAARDPKSGMPLSLLGGYAPLGVLVLVVGIVLSMLSFHQLAARYLYRLGRDRVLPAGLGRVGRGVHAGAPQTGSWVQSAIALVVIVVAAALGVDPVAGLFVPASTFAAVAVLTMLAAASAAAGRFFARGGGGREGWWIRRLFPASGAVFAGAVAGVVVANVHTLLGVGSHAATTVVLPALVALVAMVGAGRGWWLRRKRPDVFHAIGHGQTSPAARLDPRLAELTL